MKICAVQTKPIKGDIRRNIENHKRLIDQAVCYGADAIFFPELSLTGYEPELAKDLAMDLYEIRLDEFQKISDTRQVTIGLGIPAKTGSLPRISLAIFQPYQARRIYSKQYLHADEEGFFINGQSSSHLTVGKCNIALAICYEISIPEHADNAFQRGAGIYMASVVKSVESIDRSMKRLSEIAGSYSMTVLMANCVGQSGGYKCAGRSSVWNNRGVLVGQLNGKNEGIILFDTDSEKVIEKTI